jgi:hypothetical protein
MPGRPFIVLAALLLASACSKGSSSTPSTAATATPTPAPFGQHLYVGNDNPGGGIAQFTLPLTTGETPNYTVALANPTTLSFDGFNDLAAGTASGVTYYATPFTSASTASATFAVNPAPSQVKFYTGSLYETSGGTTVNVYQPPFSGGTTPYYTVSPTGATILPGVAVDAAGTLYVSNLATASGPSNLLSIPGPAPYSSGTPVSTPAVTGTIYRKIAIEGTYLFVCNIGGTTGSVDVYTLPLSATSAPTFSITTGIDVPRDVALDSAGRLYVANSGNETITEYTPNFSASSAPTTTLALPGGYSPFGIAVGT